MTKRDSKKKTGTKTSVATKKNAMLQALESSLGVVKTACKNAGISRQTHYRWLEEDQDYAKAVQDVQDVALDFAESQLFQQIQKGNTPATIFYLKCKGKNRGYVEGHELNITTSNTKPKWLNEE